MHDAREYLLEWKTNNKNWKFQKSKQNWIIRNIYTMEKDLFKIAVKYLKAGSVKTFMIEAAQTIINKETNEADEDIKKQNKIKKRARKILRKLSNSS